MSTITSVIYALLFVALLVQPHILQGHVSFVSSAWEQTLSTTVILGIAAVTYVVHRMALRRADRRSASLQQEKKITDEKLLDSFRYIGTVNRRLPLLHEVTSDVLRETAPTSRGRREAHQRLLALAVITTARAPWGLLRFIDRASGKTLGEHSLERPGHRVPRAPIGNGDLLAREVSGDQTRAPMEYVVRWGSDRWTPHQTFLVLGPHAPETLDRKTIQALVDQAHVLFTYFMSRSPAIPSSKQATPTR